MRNMKDINIGMIGGGIMCKLHSLAYAVLPLHFATDYKPVRKVLCDVDPGIAAKSAEQFLWEESCTDWRQMVAREDIDVVDVCTPNYLHREMVIEAARNKKHVYCEKPLGMSAEECWEMYCACEENGVRHAVGFDKRSWPAIAYAKQLIDEGYVGEIVYYRGTFTNSSNIDPLRPLHWRLQKKFAGTGPMGDIASHALDTARYLLGEFSEVIGTAATNIKQRPLIPTEVLQADTPMGDVDVEDTCAFLAHMENGAIASFETTRISCGEENDMRFEVYGKKGAIRWNSQYPNELMISTTTDPLDQRGFKIVEMGKPHPGSVIWPLANFAVGITDQKSIEVHRFLNAIEQKIPYEPDFYDAFRIQQVVDAVMRSDCSRSWEAIPNSSRR